MTQTEYEMMWSRLGYPSPPDNISYRGITYGDMTFSSLDAVWEMVHLLYPEEADSDSWDFEFSSCEITLAGVTISSCGGDYACVRVGLLNAGAGIALPGGHCEDR